MGPLAKDLRSLGYSRTEKESPFDDDGELWTKGYELVCDQTGVVIRQDGDNSFQYKTEDSDDEEEVYRYYNSNNVRMPGGYVSSYAWGEDDTGRFTYARSK